MNPTPPAPLMKKPDPPLREWLLRYKRRDGDEWSYSTHRSRKLEAKEVAEELVDSYMGYDWTDIEVQLLDVDESKWSHFNVKLEVA